MTTCRFTFTLIYTLNICSRSSLLPFTNLASETKWHVESPYKIKQKNKYNLQGGGDLDLTAQNTGVIFIYLFSHLFANYHHLSHKL